MQRKLRALIIDDTSDSYELLKRMLVKRGFECEGACNGAIGLNLYLKNHYDVVFLDVMMPVLDGEKFLEILDENIKNGLINPPRNIIVMTGLDEDNTKYKNILGMKNVYWFINRKPLSKNQILSNVEEILNAKDS